MEKARKVVQRYGFQESMTPLVEEREVFARTVATSDIVTKEMFELVNRGDNPDSARESARENAYVLRPEGTAPLMRAVLSNGLTQRMPLKFFYAGPMFRYDRPQKGRLRQFHQVGVELMGVPEPWADVDVLACAHDFLNSLGIKESLTLELNTLGDAESHLRFREALVDYLEPYEAALSPDSRMRLAKNPLRILDSKDEGDQDIIRGAPSLHGCLTKTAQDFFERVQAGLQALAIPYTLNPRLVRGLDYYTHTAFEFKASGLGAQSTVLAGGRYDGLSSLLGGPAIPGIGWAAGVERLMLLTTPPSPPVPQVALLPCGEEDLLPALSLAHTLRQAGLSLQVLGGPQNMGKRMQKAEKMGCTWVLLLGETERMQQTVMVKNLTQRTQEAVAQGELVGFLHKALAVASPCVVL